MYAGLCAYIYKPDIYLRIVEWREEGESERESERERERERERTKNLSNLVKPPTQHSSADLRT